jgi:2-oxoglutarate dehydrogenase complex dehydrogenase (E1) component-like enzyme
MQTNLQRNLQVKKQTPIIAKTLKQKQMSQPKTSQEKIKALAAQLNLNEVLAEANRIGAKKKTKVVFHYSAIYATLNRVRSKKINPILIEAIETLAAQKSEALSNLINKKDEAEKPFA